MRSSKAKATSNGKRERQNNKKKGRQSKAKDTGKEKRQRPNKGQTGGQEERRTSIRNMGSLTNAPSLAHTHERNATISRLRVLGGLTSPTSDVGPLFTLVAIQAPYRPLCPHVDALFRFRMRSVHADTAIMWVWSSLILFFILFLFGCHYWVVDLRC